MEEQIITFNSDGYEKCTKTNHILEINNPNQLPRSLTQFKNIIQQQLIQKIDQNQILNVDQFKYLNIQMNKLQIMAEVIQTEPDFDKILEIKLNKDDTTLTQLLNKKSVYSKPTNEQFLVYQLCVVGLISPVDLLNNTKTQIQQVEKCNSDDCESIQIGVLNIYNQIQHFIQYIMPFNGLFNRDILQLINCPLFSIQQRTNLNQIYHIFNYRLESNENNSLCSKNYILLTFLENTFYQIIPISIQQLNTNQLEINFDQYQLTNDFLQTIIYQHQTEKYNLVQNDILQMRQIDPALYCQFLNYHCSNILKGVTQQMFFQNYSKFQNITVFQQLSKIKQQFQQFIYSFIKQDNHLKLSLQFILELLKNLRESNNFLLLKVALITLTENANPIVYQLIFEQIGIINQQIQDPFVENLKNAPENSILKEIDINVFEQSLIYSEQEKKYYKSINTKYKNIFQQIYQSLKIEQISKQTISSSYNDINQQNNFDKNFGILQNNFKNDQYVNYQNQSLDINIADDELIYSYKSLYLLNKNKEVSLQTMQQLDKYLEMQMNAHPPVIYDIDNVIYYFSLIVNQVKCQKFDKLILFETIAKISILVGNLNNFVFNYDDRHFSKLQQYFYSCELLNNEDVENCVQNLIID